MPPPTASQKPPKLAPEIGTAAPKKGGAAAGEDRVSKPDQAKYNAEQDALNKQIADVKAKLDAVRSRIALSQAPGGNDRRSQIKAELDGLRSEQSKFKADRGKLFDELRRLQESVSKKIEAAKAARGKVAFKSVADVEARIGELEAQVESGRLKLVDEKKALAEITNLKRARRTLETTGSADDAIAEDKKRIEDVRAQLDDPEAKKVADKYDALKKELDALNEEGNKAYEERNKLYDERNALSSQLDDIYGQKRELAQKHRDDGDKYWAQVHADRAAKQERYKADKAKEDAARKAEEIARLREEAKAPAYAAEMEDCRILIGYFTGKTGGDVETNASKAANGAGAGVTGVKELEIRKVESDFEGMQLKKKGGDDELAGFFGGSKKKKGGNGGKKSATPSGTQTPAADAVNLPMGLLSALLTLGIPPPSGKDDVARVVSDIETKKAWYEANSAAKTKAEIERVEKLVAKMQKGLPTEEGGVKEPVHTTAVAGEAVGPETLEEEAHQLPIDASENDELKHVDSALSNLKDSGADADAE
ncbi:multicopy suppressor of BFA (Brefeldin A) [Cryptotrichosporon argae]